VKIVVLCIMAAMLTACGANFHIPGANSTGATPTPTGVWQSPYECYTDDGNGRRNPCSINQ
jgi:hypothetical protein